MKNLLTILFLVAASLLSQAQTSLFQKLGSVIEAQTGKQPEKKLIALTVWSAEDQHSRALNTEFNKASTIYEFAKLKGGPHGLTGITFSTDKDKVMINVTLKKDGINKLISIVSDDKELLKALESLKPGYNVVFDKDGKIVYENLKEGTVFTSINQLITR